MENAAKIVKSKKWPQKLISKVKKVHEVHKPEEAK
jgi:hypothetical protein